MKRKRLIRKKTIKKIIWIFVSIMVIFSMVAWTIGPATI